MNLKSLERRLSHLEDFFGQLIAFLPGEREVWGFMKRNPELDLMHVANLWYPTILIAMRQKDSPGDPSLERIKEYLLLLIRGREPGVTLYRPFPESPPGGFPSSPGLEEALPPLGGDSEEDGHGDQYPVGPEDWAPNEDPSR